MLVSKCRPLLTYGEVPACALHPHHHSAVCFCSGPVVVVLARARVRLQLYNQPPVVVNSTTSASHLGHKRKKKYCAQKILNHLL